MPRWTVAFFAASFVALAITPALRHLALATGFVDVPDLRRKVHANPVPYLGGVALMVSVFAALSFELRLTSDALVIVALAAALGTVGLLDDRHHIDPRLRFLAQFAAAAVAVGVGVRIHATGSVVTDVLMTVIWIVGVTNALNLLDNMDGLAGGVAAAASVNIFLLAGLSGQPVVATIAAAVVGACLGFLAYNRPPASIFMGDAGSLFLGFVVAILAVEVDPILTPPTSFIVPLLLLALPVLDTSTVTIARLRHGLPVSEGGRDHLSHRLVARGFSRKAAMMILVAAEAFLGFLAVLTGRRALPLGTALLLAVTVLGVIAVLISSAEVYSEKAVGIPRRLRAVLVAALVLIPVVAAPTIVAVRGAIAPTRRGTDLVLAALESLRRADSDSVHHFERAVVEFAKAREELAGRAVTLGLGVPGVSSNVGAARAIAAVGEELSRIGTRLAALITGPLAESGDAATVAQLVRLETELGSADKALDDALRQLAGVDRGFLIPTLRRSIATVSTEVERQSSVVKRSVDAVRLAKELLGVEGARRFLLSLPDGGPDSGQQAVGANLMELVADHGRLNIEGLGTEALSGEGVPPAVNTGPSDFHIAARHATEAYERWTGNTLHGFVALDVDAIAELMELTGPVSVPASAAPVTSGSFLDMLRGENSGERRSALVRQVGVATAQALTTADLGTALRVVAPLRRAVEGGHIRIYLPTPSHQDSATRLGVGGEVAPSKGIDSVVVERHGGDAVPAGLIQQRMTYDVTLDPSTTPAHLSGRLQLSTHRALTGGTPDVPSFLSVRSSLPSGTVTIDGEPGQRPPSGAATAMPLPDVGERTLTVEVAGSVRLSPRGWYGLDILQRPVSAEDQVEVTISVPKGWRIAESRGAQIVSPQSVRATEAAPHTETIWVRLERSGAAGILERFFAQP